MATLDVVSFNVFFGMRSRDPAPAYGAAGLRDVHGCQTLGRR
jgi:hypothetical protein